MRVVRVEIREDGVENLNGLLPFAKAFELFGFLEEFFDLSFARGAREEGFGGGGGVLEFLGGNRGGEKEWTNAMDRRC